MLLVTQNNVGICISCCLGSGRASAQKCQVLPATFSSKEERTWKRNLIRKLTGTVTKKLMSDQPYRERSNELPVVLRPDHQDNIDAIGSKKKRERERDIRKSEDPRW